MADTSQIRIVHLSDLHFHSPESGDSVHRFAPLATPAGDPMASPGHPGLMDSLWQDWASPEWASERITGHVGPLGHESVVVALTGDLTQTAAPAEFNLLDAFVTKLCQQTVFNHPITPKNIFVVPGNHDVVYGQTDVSARWQPYCTYYQRLKNHMVDPREPGALTRVIDRSDIGLIVVELNSCAYVQRGTLDAQRGHIDDRSLAALRKQLEEIDTDKREKCVRIALVHHHPIVLPQLVEPGRNYDAIVNAEKLITILQRFQFHAVLHGHKHNPHTFSIDAAPAWSPEPVHPLTIIAGGSVSATELPNQWQSATNTYNVITIKWHPASQQGKLRVITRGLVRHHDNGQPFDFPAEWRWRSLRVENRRLVQKHMFPEPKGRCVSYGEHISQEVLPDEEKRAGWYSELRGNMPVIEVMPSLEPGQIYEARMWLVGHPSRQAKDIPHEVIWSAGPKFPIWVCQKTDNNDFCANYHYWGPMAVQALIKFSDGTETIGHVYARIPDAGVGVGVGADMLTSALERPSGSSSQVQRDGQERNRRNLPNLAESLPLPSPPAAVAEIAHLTAENARLKAALSSHETDTKTVEIQRIIDHLKLNTIRTGRNFYQLFIHLAPDLAVGASAAKIFTYVRQVFSINQIGIPSDYVLRETVDALCSQLRIANLIKIETRLKENEPFQSSENTYFLTDLGSALALHAQLEK